MIRKSFALCGIYPLNLKQMISQCTARIQATEVETIKASMEPLIQWIRDFGEITEQRLDELGIGQTTRKDDLVVSRRRSILLNNEGYLLTEYNKNLLNFAAANIEAEKKRLRVEAAAARK